MIQAVGFDFDGTLKQSNSIKSKAYFDTVSNIKGGADIFRGIIHEFPMMTRYSGCEIFEERAKAHGIHCPPSRELVERYSQICEDAIVNCAEVPGAEAFLNWLKVRRVSCFVVSGTPQVPLRNTIQRIGWSGYFSDILGYPVEKSEHYNTIMSLGGYKPDMLLVVGDGDDDKAASTAVGGHFVRIRNGVGTTQQGEWSVSNLTEICEIEALKFPHT